MRYRVWRSLDRPSSFFGVKGRFAYVFIGLAAVGGVVAAITGSVSNSLVGMVAFALALTGDYMLVTTLQGKMSDRALSRFLASRKTPRCIHLRPRNILSYLNRTSLWK